MALPHFVSRSYAGGAQATQLAFNMDDTQLTFTISGSFANYPTGSGGPFTMAVDDGLQTVEKILCSALDISTGIVTVWDTGGTSGRGYDGTSPNAHTALAAPAPQVRPCWTATEAAEANMAVVYMLGQAGVTTGEVLTWDTGGFPQWQAPGGSGNQLPVGGICLYGAASAPTNFAICDGRAVSRTTYSQLFTLYGTTYGPGDGSTTFNIPDMRDKFAIGANSTLTLGTSGGSLSITTSNMPSHNHPATSVDTGHLHFTGNSQGFMTASWPSSTLYTNNGSNVDHSPSWNIQDQAATDYGTAMITTTISNTGSSTPYLQPAIGLNYIIRLL